MITALFMGTLMAGLTACAGNGDADALDVDFDIPRSEQFPGALSAYGLFEGPMAELVPADSVFEYELASPLFTDYAHKQRLVKLPDGQTMTIKNSLTATYPEGTVVAKTFYYPLDFSDLSQGWEVIETRVMVLRSGQWNVAAYIWNDEQTDATLALEGGKAPVAWKSEQGAALSTDYEIPDEVACVTCHQRAGSVELLGLRPRNLNFGISRAGQVVNQLVDLQSRGLVSGKSADSLSSMAAYDDRAFDLKSRARAYLDVNCAHCHNPDAWDLAAQQDLDFRYETSFRDTGIRNRDDDLREVLRAGEMPFIGTTMIDDEGVELVLKYLDTL